MSALQGVRGHLILETNHERTLYVPYVFRNHLISGERDQLSSREALSALNAAAAGCRKPSLWRPRARKADVSKVPVPQRDSPTASCPDGSRALRSTHRRRALPGVREDNLRAGRFRRDRGREARTRARDG